MQVVKMTQPQAAGTRDGDVAVGDGQGDPRWPGQAARGLQRHPYAVPSPSAESAVGIGGVEHRFIVAERAVANLGRVARQLREPFPGLHVPQRRRPLLTAGQQHGRIGADRAAAEPLVRTQDLEEGGSRRRRRLQFEPRRSGDPPRRRSG